MNFFLLCMLFLLILLVLLKKQKLKLLKLLDKEKMYKEQIELQKKELENKVEEKTDELNRYFNLIKDGIAIADVQTKKFMDCNKAFEELTGYTKKELILLTIDEIHPKDSLAYVLHEFKEQARGKKVIALNIPILHKSGKDITIVDVSIGSYDKNGLTFNVGIFRNISDRLILEKELINLNKNLENKVKDQVEKLRQKETLIFQQSKLAAMGEMLGNIAHQWRQPLSTISTAATGAKLLKEMNILTDEDFNKSMDGINDASQYLSQTIDVFRGFFAPLSKEKEFYISEALSKTLNLVSAQFIDREIEIIENIESYQLVTLENELIQVLINIFNNAKDALLKKENQRRLIFINTYRKKDISYIEILDNAGGIEENIINKVFEPYFTTKHQSQGTGIGLYMSEEIVRTYLHGNLLVSNETFFYEDIEYIGAKFTIEIMDD